MDSEQLRIKVGEQVGGILSAMALKGYLEMSKRGELVLKRAYLKERAIGLVLQNPGSGFGTERLEARRVRFRDVCWRAEAIS